MFASFLTSVNSLSSAASVSLVSSLLARTTGLSSFLRPFTLFFDFVVVGASLSITTVDKQSRKSSKLDTSSEEIIGVTQVFVRKILQTNAGKHDQASPPKPMQCDDLVYLTSDLDLNSMLILSGQAPEFGDESKADRFLEIARSMASRNVTALN